jgi:hypothetical protein
MTVKRLLLFSFCLFFAFPTLAVWGRETTFHILDVNTKKPVKARCRVTDASGEVFHPPFSKEIAPGPGGTFYAEGSFQIDLPTGTECQLSVDRGMHWNPSKNDFVLGATVSVVTNLLQPFVNLWKARWYSGDLDVQIPFNEAPEILGSADLYAGCRVFDASQHEAQVPKMERGPFTFLGKVAMTSGDWGFEDFNLIGAGSEMRLDETPYRSTQLPHLIKGRTLAGMVDVLAPESQEMAVAAALGWVNTVRVVGPRSRTEPADTRAKVLDRFAAYYRLLNCGFTIGVSAASLASEKSPSPEDRVGASRVYVRILSDFSLGNFLRGLKKGRSWATNGPVLLLTVNGKDPGDTTSAKREGLVKVGIGAHSPRPLERVELIYNGVVAATVPLSATQSSVVKTFNLPVAAGGWIAARAFEKQTDPSAPLRYAHTSPVYLQEGQIKAPHSEAQMFANLLTQRIHTASTDASLSEEEKSFILEWYGKARDVYLGLVR